MKTFTALTASAAALAYTNATITNLGVEEDTFEDYSLKDFNMFGDVSGLPQYLECMACGKAVDWFDNSVLGNKKTVDYVFDVIAAGIFISGLFHPRFASKELVVQFGTPINDTLKNHLLTKDRICNETLGFCSRPKITPIDLQSVVDGILATKPAII